MIQKRTLNIDLPITVKTYDIDFMGIVSNISYVRWMEDLRLQFLDIHYPMKKLIAELIVPILSHTHLDYKRPNKMHDQVIGSIWMEKFDSSGWIANMEFTANGKLAATGATGRSIYQYRDYETQPIRRRVCKRNMMRRCSSNRKQIIYAGHAEFSKRLFLKSMSFKFSILCYSTGSH